MSEQADPAPASGRPGVGAELVQALEAAGERRGRSRNIGALRRLIPFARRRWGDAALSTVFLLLSTGATLGMSGAVRLLVEHLTRAGVEMGLSPENAHKLATKTAAGSAKMMLTTADSPTELRRKVTTPNGTTHAAMSHMEQQGMPQIIVDALKAAQRRSKALGS